MTARVVWLVYSRGMQFRRVRHGAATPPMREDEHAYRVVLPEPVPASRAIVTLDAERVA
jgi:hypothetical protein